MVFGNNIQIRPPAVAGQFYPKNSMELRKLIKNFLDQQPDNLFIPQKIKSFIVPHAGYIYSGPIATAVYKILSLSNWQPEKIILIGPSHYLPIADFVFSSADYWETPLGKISLLKPPLNGPFNDLAFQKEHSLEVQLPFLQTILKNFKILPILINNEVESGNLAALIKPILDEATLLIISSDLSHYLPLEMAQKIDKKTHQIILQLKINEKDKLEVCGAAAILTLMHLAKKLDWKTKLIAYQTSFETSGDKETVVGYGAYLFYQ